MSSPAEVDSERHVRSPRSVRERIAAFARNAGTYVPDATASSIIMLAALVAISLALGDSLVTSVDAYYRGLWMLLPFRMQIADFKSAGKERISW